ncbi:MAG: MOSC domain-containing protein, partial [Actinobacteria bacterium]|nr:MOSC domain-containing protein [Actinomycetota bacterium]
VDDDGRVVNGLRYGALVAVAPAFDAATDRLTLRFPDGSEVDGTVTLGERIETDWTERVVAGRVVAGAWADALSDFVGRRVRLVCAEQPGSGCSHHGVSLLSDASVAELTRAEGLEEVVDARRFRMLIALAGCEPHEEDMWIGRLVEIGEALVRVVEPTARCATTTRDPSSGRRDLDTLRAIKGYRGLSGRRTIDFGVYGVVERPGRVRVGDRAQPLATGSS